MIYSLWKRAVRDSPSDFSYCDIHTHQWTHHVNRRLYAGCVEGRDFQYEIDLVHLAAAYGHFELVNDRVATLEKTKINRHTWVTQNNIGMATVCGMVVSAVVNSIAYPNKTALDYAVLNQNGDIVHFLIAQGSRANNVSNASLYRSGQTL
jgi:hypothetical protein